MRTGIIKGRVRTKKKEGKRKERKKGRKKLKNFLEVAILYLFRIRSLPVFVGKWGEENINHAQNILFTRHVVGFRAHIRNGKRK